MKNYSIEIELIDKTGKSIKNNNSSCKINSVEISAEKKGVYVLNQDFEKAENKNNYKIECGNKTISLKLAINNGKISYKNTKLEFIFIADHAVSNTTKCVKRDYFEEDIWEGVFESGASTKIIRKV